MNSRALSSNFCLASDVVALSDNSGLSCLTSSLDSLRYSILVPKFLPHSGRHSSQSMTAKPEKSGCSRPDTCVAPRER